MNARRGSADHRLHFYGFIAKIPRSRQWRVIKTGLRVVGGALKLREQTFPDLYASAYA